MFHLLMKIYLYNITNPDDFLKGKKPVFEEKGPYIFDQTMTRRIHGWEENETLINFEVFKSFKFNPHLTEHSLNDKITVLNFPLLVSFVCLFCQVRLLIKPCSYLISKDFDKNCIRHE